MRAAHKLAIKIHVGGANIVSGEAALQNMASLLRRSERIKKSISVQDYVVTQRQHWLEGIAAKSGEVRQFVATTTGPEYSVETQVIGCKVVNGL